MTWTHLFWQFVYTIIAQIDTRPANERDREGEEENPTQHCKHVPLGQYSVTSETYKGSLKSKQARCKYCPLRKKRVSLEFHHLHVSNASFLMLLFAENIIVGTSFGRSTKKSSRRIRYLVCPAIA
jgi:hypothetical protein